MPRIPLAARPQLGGHQDSTAPLSGAPSLGWNADNGLERMGDAIARGSDAVGGTALRGIDAALALSAQKQYADDEDNFSQIQLEAQKEYGDFQSQTRENPNEYAKFADWRQESTARLSERVKPYLEKLSVPARRRADHFLAENALTQEKWASDISFQADITAKRENYDTRIRHYAKTGDTDAAREQLQRGIATGIFNANERERYENFIGELADFGAAECRIDSNDPAIAEELKKRNEAGNYVNFPGLSSDNRRQLIRYAEQRQARREVELTDAFVSDVLAGKTISEDSVLKRTDIRQGTKNDFIKILRSVQNTKVKQQTAEQKQARQYARDALEFEIMEHSFSPDPVERDKQFAAFNRRIYTEFAKDDPAYAKQLKTQLNESLKAATKPDMSYKKTAAYGYAMAKLDGLKDELYSKYDSPRGFLWLETDADEPEVKKGNYAMFRVKLDEFLRLNPKASQGEIDHFIDTTKKSINETEVSKRLELFAGAPRIDAAPTQKKGTFDSRKIRTGVSDPSGFIGLSEEGEIKKNRLAGKIDKADIVRMGKNKAGRVVWELNDGRKVFADEYE